MPFDLDGAGSAHARLLVGGFFTAAGGLSARGDRHLGRRLVDLGLGGRRPVRTLTRFDAAGTRPALPVICGGRRLLGPHRLGSVAYVAFWDGGAWIPAGVGPGGPVFAAVVYDLDAIPRLRPRTSREALWGRGLGWFGLDRSRGARHQGSRAHGVRRRRPRPQLPALFAGGSTHVYARTSSGGRLRLDDVGSGGLGPCGGFPPSIDALAVFDEDGPGPGLPFLFAGGNFTTPSRTSRNGMASSGRRSEPASARRRTKSSSRSRWSTPGLGLPAAELVAAGRFIVPFNTSRSNGSAGSTSRAACRPAAPLRDRHSLRARSTPSRRSTRTEPGPCPRAVRRRRSIMWGRRSRNLALWTGAAWSGRGPGISGGPQTATARPAVSPRSWISIRRRRGSSGRPVRRRRLQEGWDYELGPPRARGA